MHACIHAFALLKCVRSMFLQIEYKSATAAAQTLNNAFWYAAAYAHRFQRHRISGRKRVHRAASVLNTNAVTLRCVCWHPGPGSRARVMETYCWRVGWCGDHFIRASFCVCVFLLLNLQIMRAVLIRKIEASAFLSVCVFLLYREATKRPYLPSRPIAHALASSLLAGQPRPNATGCMRAHARHPIRSRQS